MILGLNGRGRCGKDSACRHLATVLNPRPVIRDAFADRLKDSAAAALSIDRGLMEKYKDDPDSGIEVTLGVGKTVMSIRAYLEHYGTEAHRDIFAQDFWIKAVIDAHRERGLTEYGTPVTVVTDLRFPNEADAIHAEGGEVWQISRPGHELVSDHPSNQPLPEPYIDRFIVNDSGMAEFKEKVTLTAFDALKSKIRKTVADAGLLRSVR